MKLTKQIEQEMIRQAQEGVKNAFTGTNKPDDFRIGAAVLTDKGNIYASGQYASDTHSLTLHSEQAALAHAAAHGEYNIEAVVVTWNATASQGSGSVYPCHMCKQLLYESYLRSGINTQIILVDETGKILERLELKQMINYPWP